MKKGLTLEALCQEIKRQDEAKQDYLVQSGCLMMESFGGSPVLRVIGDNGLDQMEPLDITTTAHRQLGTYLQIPAGYYDRMLKDFPDLLTYNVNSWLARSHRPKLLRTLDYSVRAILSNRYLCADHIEILQVALPILGEIPEMHIESCEITESRMYIKIVNKRLEVDVVPGDTVQYGIVITNSEIGHGSIQIQPFIYRLVCSNGMVVPQRFGDGTRRIHKGKTLHLYQNVQPCRLEGLESNPQVVEQLQRTLRNAMEGALFEQITAMMRQAAEVPIEATDLTGVVRQAGSLFGIREAEQPGILRHLTSAQDMTLYGLANAVTRYSQDVESYDRATELEAIGYDLMAMPRSQWSNINQAAAQMAAA